MVKDIFKMRTDGYSAERIATELNRLAVLSPMEYKKDNNISLPTGGYCDKGKFKMVGNNRNSYFQRQKSIRAS